MSIGLRLPYNFGEFYNQRLRNAFLAESGFVPQLAANIVIFQTNAQFVGIFSSDDSWPVIFGENRCFPPNGNGM